MGSKLYFDPKAEQEANEVATQFMDSSDVIGDMSRTYGMDFSSVHIHTDESAAQRVAPTGADAFSTGRDIFFGRGAFHPNDPASRGLLAHELTHTMQQGIGGEEISGGGGEQTVDQAAPEGAAQGGMLDWFKGKFGKKKPTPEELAEMEEIQNMEISEPELQIGPSSGPINVSMKNGMGDNSTYHFMNSQSYAINQMIKGASRKQLQDPAVRKLVLDDYNANMNTRLKSLNHAEKLHMDAEAFRGNAGELDTFNAVLASMLPENFDQKVLANIKNPRSVKDGEIDAALDTASGEVGKNEDLMNFMADTDASFEGITNYQNVEDRSAIMMNNLVLRGINGSSALRIGKARRAAVDALAAKGITDKKSQNKAENAIDSSDLLRAGRIQKAVNMSNSDSASNFRGMLTNLFKKRSKT